jgi:hypothetical protein
MDRPVTDLWIGFPMYDGSEEDGLSTLYGQRDVPVEVSNFPGLARRDGM